MMHFFIKKKTESLPAQTEMCWTLPRCIKDCVFCKTTQPLCPRVCARARVCEGRVRERAGEKARDGERGCVFSVQNNSAFISGSIYKDFIQFLSFSLSQWGNKAAKDEK